MLAILAPRWQGGVVPNHFWLRSRYEKGRLAGRGAGPARSGGVADTGYARLVVIDDTHPEARRIQFDCLRRLTNGERLRMADELSAMTTFVSRQAIRDMLPAATEQQVILRWIEIVYGKDLAARVAPLAERLGRPGPRP